MSTTIDKAGRIIVPKALRDRFHLVAGTQLEITADDSGIHLSPVARGPALVQKDGILIHHGKPVDIDVVAFMQSERDRRHGLLAAEYPDE